MNPETTLKEQDIKNICDQHGILFRHAKRITDGFTNEVHLINDDIIFKACTRPDNIDRFRIESKVLRLQDAIAKPKFIADDFSKNIIAAPYILMSYVAGQALGSIWHTLSDKNREELIRDIAYNLRLFNAIEVEELFGTPKLWGDSLVNGFAKSSQDLLRSKILNQVQVDSVTSILERYQSIFNKTETKVVFWDIHFDNFIINNNKLAAIIDLEAVDQMAIDYPLFVVSKQIEDPIKFLSLENEKYANKADYVHLWEWYQKYYPEMFNVENIEERVKIYRMLDVTHLLKDWSHNRVLYKQLAYYIKELA